MHDEPENLSSASLIAALQRYWGIDVREIEYAPVGFGSYHWIASQPDGRKWFVTADNVEPTGEIFAKLKDAYATAATLRDSGLAFVVAPVPDSSDQLLRQIEPESAIAVFNYIEGKPAGKGSWQDVAACVRAAGLVGRLHASAPPDTLRRFSFDLAHRASLFDDLSVPWTLGPFGEPARKLLRSAREAVEALLAHYDRLVSEVMADDEAWVVTHGEPHSANFIDGADGRLHLIDWDTVRLAPAERDLAALLIDEPDVLTAYQASAGPRQPRPEALKLFSIWWHVTDICIFVNDLRGPHSDSPDNRVRWQDLERYLHVEANWPDLASWRS